MKDPAADVHTDGAMDSAKSGSSVRKRSSGKKKEKKLDSGYFRVLGIRDKDIMAQNNKKYESISTGPKLSGLLHIFSGEKKEVS